jgi:PAS domain S-box-containing protein
MVDLWMSLFDGGDFMPHGHCYLWNPGLVRLHLLTDLAIGIAYVAISLTLAYLVGKAKRDMPFSWIFACFGLFIIACGATHFMEIWTLWTPLYWLSGTVKLVTAVASVATALVLPPLVPRSLALIRAAGQLERLNASLEQRVEARTAELSAANLALAGLAAIVEQSNDAIVSVDRDGRIMTWNPAAERIYGFGREEVVGQSVSLLAPPGLSKETSELVERLKGGERVSSLETIRVRKTGDPIDVSLTLSAIKNESGEFQGASIIARDITERKRGEEMFRLAVEAAPNAMVMVDGDGHIMLVNAQTEKLFGYRRDELIGRDVDILIPHPYRGVHRGFRSEFMHQPRVRGLGTGRDVHGLRKDGSEFPAEIGLNPIRTGQGTWVLSAILDITERKREEREIHLLNQELEHRVAERTAELSAVNAELEAFSYSISHDLRAPLRQIAGFAGIVVEDYGPQLAPECQGYLHRVQDGAQHMGHLVDALLNLSRMGQQMVSLEAVPINPIIDAALEVLKPECVNREIEWQIETLSTLECDAMLLRQVFANLLSNALKFTRNRTPAIIHIGSKLQNGELVIFIRDNGSGFDMQYAGKLFGVFQRFHRAQDFEGTGVGLAIAQRIIRKHGGRIWAEAEPDQGATFFFTIPSNPKAAIHQEEDSEAQRGEPCQHT